MNLKKYWDLILIIILSLLLLLVIQYYPDSMIRKILGIVFVIFFPGYVFINTLFPKKDDLDSTERLALSFGLSIAIVPLIGLFLNYTPWGIRLIPILISLIFFNICFGMFAIYRRYKARDPWIPIISIEKLKNEIEWDNASKLDKILTIVLLIAIICSIVTLFYLMTHPKQSERFTEFYILGPNGKAYDYPTELFTGEKGKVIIGIVNHEGRNVTYYVEVWLVNLSYDFNTNNTYIHNMYLLDTFNVTLPPKPVNIEGNWTPEWEKNYTFSINKSGKWQIWFLLFKDKKPKLPKPINGDYANTSAKIRIIEAINGTIQSLKLNVNVKKI